MNSLTFPRRAGRLGRAGAGGALLATSLLTGLIAPPWVARTADPGEQLRRSVPAATVFSFEILQPRTLLEPLLSEAMVHRVEALPVWPALRANPGFGEFLGGVGLFEVTVGTDWRQALREFVGGGALFAAAPGKRAVVLVNSLNPDRLGKFHGLLARLAGDEARKRGEADPVTSHVEAGVTRWSFDGKETHAVIGSRLVLASDATVFDRVMATAAGPRESSLAGSPLYRAARRAVGRDVAAMLFLNLRALRQAPGVARALAAPRSNPLGVLLAGSLPDALREADWLGVGFRVEGDALVARAVAGPASAAGETPAAHHSTGPARPKMLPDPELPRELAALQLHRDLHGFYAAKDELFPDRTSGLIFFENMMGIFFTGRDLTDEVLAATQPELNFVVARQDYGEALVPRPELPGFALVLRLRDPDAFRPVLEEAWQKALGLVNFTRGQQAEPGLILDRPRHGGIAYTTAHFSQAGLEAEAARDIRFNFQPTLAMPGEFAILSSSESLARQLMDALAKPASARPVTASAHTALRLDGPTLATLLAANREALVRNNMIEEGHTRQEAELGIDTLLSVARQVAGLEFSLADAPGPVNACLAVHFAPAPPALP